MAWYYIIGFYISRVFRYVCNIAYKNNIPGFLSLWDFTFIANSSFTLIIIIIISSTFTAKLKTPLRPFRIFMNPPVCNGKWNCMKQHTRYRICDDIAADIIIPRINWKYYWFSSQWIICFLCIMHINNHNYRLLPISGRSGLFSDNTELNLKIVAICAIILSITNVRRS